MNPIYWYCAIFAILLFCVGYCNRKFCMLKDLSNANKQPYSWSRVQLAWWSLIILTGFISIMIIHGDAPTLQLSTVILLGISAATITAASSIDTADANKPLTIRHQDKDSVNFFIDILSDETGVSIHRFQTVIFNLAFGIWFIAETIHNLTNPNGNISLIMPNIDTNNLILLGLSSATYAALKSNENKEKPGILPIKSTNLTNLLQAGLMAQKTFKFSITHPQGMAIIRLRIDTTELSKSELDAFITATSPNVIIDGTLTASIITGTTDIEWEAVGQPNLAGTIAVKYNNKDMLKDHQGDILIPANGRTITLLENISLPAQS